VLRLHAEVINPHEVRMSQCGDTVEIVAVTRGRPVGVAAISDAMKTSRAVILSSGARGGGR